MPSSTLQISESPSQDVSPQGEGGNSLEFSNMAEIKEEFFGVGAILSKGGDMDEEEEEDALPDWTKLTKDHHGKNGSFWKYGLGFEPSHPHENSAPKESRLQSQTPQIPKRGEKDFEPVQTRDFPDSNVEKDGRFDSNETETDQQRHEKRQIQQHQLSMLSQSQDALFQALSSGSRHHSSRAYNSFTFRPDLLGPGVGRASCDPVHDNSAGQQGQSVTFGIHFLTIGRWEGERKRLELRPEEALYLLERGAIELWNEEIEDENSAPTTNAEIDWGLVLGQSHKTKARCTSRGRVPMTVQQAWAVCIGNDGLSLEKFQVYAYLKRLGYVVIRAPNKPKILPRVDSQERASQNQGIPDLLHSKLTSTLKALQHILYQLYSPPYKFIMHVPALVTLLRETSMSRLLGKPPISWRRVGFTRAIKQNEAKLQSLVCGNRWTSYDAIFDQLQIIPTGWDLPIDRQSTSGTISPTDYSEASISLNARQGNNLERAANFSFVDNSNPYQVFWHIYKPGTKFKKSAPPSPDFYMVVISANTTRMPDLFGFSALFDSIPIEEHNIKVGQKAGGSGISRPHQKQQQRTPTHKGRTEMQASANKPWVTKLWQKLPFTQDTPAMPKGHNGRKYQKGPSPYPKLKTGRRSIVVAVVDQGTISFLRFSEAEFGKLAWSGSQTRSV